MRGDNNGNTCCFAKFFPLAEHVDRLQNFYDDTISLPKRLRSVPPSNPHPESPTIFHRPEIFSISELRQIEFYGICADYLGKLSV